MNLRLKQLKLNKKTRKKIYHFLVIFVVSVIFFEIVLNLHFEKSVSAIETPTLPTIEVNAQGLTLNQLRGYTQEMDSCYMRDAVIPLSEDRKVDLSISAKDYEVSGISYEIRSLDTERKIAQRDVEKFEKTDDVINLNLQLENLVEENEEYLFIITLTSGDKEIYYYARILLPGSDCNLAECLDFITSFHETALGSDYRGLSTFVETSPYADTDTLSHVTIESSLEQIGWKDFDGQVVGTPVLELNDICNSYTAATYYYTMVSNDTYYQVEEYFRVRFATERMYLLDYTRDMEEILSKGSATVEDNVLNVGVLQNDPTYLSNETGTIVAFVQAGELFEYNQNKQELTKVFGFIFDPTSVDTRETYNKHKIQILNMDETGTMDFVVYGYMNSGAHEGNCGIDLYHYDGSKKTAEEKVFVATTNSYEILNASFSKLLYTTADDQFYILVGGSLIHMNLDEYTAEEVLTGLTYNRYAVSDSGRYIAWTEEYMSEELNVLDLETNKQYVKKAGDNTYIRALSYIDDSLIYGVAYRKNITTDAAGSTVYPMHAIYIVDSSNGEFAVKKEFKKSGVYIRDVSIDAYTINIECMKHVGDTFVETDSETIKNSSGEKNKAVVAQQSLDEIKGKVTKFILAEIGKDDSINEIKYGEGDVVIRGDDKTMAVSATNATNQYFVYVGSHVSLATDTLQRAIKEADDNMGVVVDNNQQYIWRRGRRSYVNAFKMSVGSQDTTASSSAQCISAMAVREGENLEVHTMLEQGATPLSILQRALKDVTILDLTGCNLRQVLYYVSQGNPVYGRLDGDQAVLVVGYEPSTIIIYNPVTDTKVRMSIDEASAKFESAGNVFISYVK